MLTILLGTDWKANTAQVLRMVADDVKHEKGGRILMVPELISHETERRLCQVAGDTSSRFAEVLSFTRLARRVADAAGHGAMECLDNGGRVVAMAAATRQMHSKLKAYAAVETKPEFLTGLVEAVDEFKRCCVTSDDLRAAAKQTEGSLAQKLEELSLVLDAYDSLCANGRRDPRDQMTWLLEQLEDSSFAKDHVFYFDAFPDFSRQHMAILEHLICNSDHVVISLTCDKIRSSALAFEKAGSTAFDLIKCAENNGVEVVIKEIYHAQNGLKNVTDTLLQGKLTKGAASDVLQIYQMDSVYGECEATAQKIIELVQFGCRYRDISVVCTDMSVYHDPVNMILHRARIPIYISGSEDILEKTVIHTVLSALDAALGGFAQKEVVRYLKSLLSPVSAELCDRLENYAILWSIDGSHWLEEWVNHPAGLGEEWTDDARSELAQLNEARRIALEPLIRLRKGFKDAADLRRQVEALYGYLNDIGLSKQLRDLADEMDRRGDNRNAQILNQLWDILMEAMEQLYDVLGNTVWDAETFTRLLKLLLSQYDVGTIPTVLDAVTVGPISAMRCQTPKHLFVLGATEGSFPGYGGSAGILNDQERAELQKMGITLNAGSIDGLQTAFSEIYDIFCGAQESVTVSCPAGQPSFIYTRLKEMAGGENPPDVLLGAALSDPWEAGALLVKKGSEADSEAIGIQMEYAGMLRHRAHELGNIERKHIQALYGSRLLLSASQIDRLAECRLSYFLKYGLRAKERKAARIDPAEFGSYVHAVLEECGRKILSMGGFHEVSLDKTLELAAEASSRYFAERFSQIESDRLTYHFHRNAHEVQMVVEELWHEMQDSDFQAHDFEVGFGTGQIMEAVSVPGTSMDAALRGFVDRVDTWENDGKTYFRVVDYKTGKKDFDYCDIFNGIGLQMLLYLYALEDEGEAVVGHDPVPVGVQYFPARVPLVACDGVLSDEEAALAHEKTFKRKGLLLNDERILTAMEHSEKPRRLSYSKKKDGTISGDIASTQQFKRLKQYVFRLLQNMVDQIASGCVTPNPYTRGSSHNACTFCPYGAVCKPAEVEGRRNYQAMSAERFWEEIEKELKRNG